MSLATLANPIVPITIPNDLVVYHKNLNNHVVLGISGSSNALVVSASNVSIKGPLVTSSAYPYGLILFSAGGGGSASAFAPLTGSLGLSARNGLVAGANSQSFNVPHPGLYMFSFSYNLGNNNSIWIVADGNTTSFDYGQLLTTTTTTTSSSLPGAVVVSAPIGYVTVMINVNSYFQLMTDFSPTGTQTLGVRGLF